MEKLNYTQVKQIDFVDYLNSLGHLPTKINHSDYWYLSPLRDEKTASFKVNRRLNLWYDHGMGKGGDLIDFGKVYFKCTTRELLERLSGQTIPIFSFHPTPSAGEKKENPESKIVIVDSRPLADKSLLDYLQKRRIPLDIASRFCREVDFLLYGKKHTVKRKHLFL